MDRKRITIVEDEKSINDMLYFILTDTLGSTVEVKQFFDLPENKLDLSESDLLIMDCNLPSGYLCDMECFHKCEIPKIIITGDSTMVCNGPYCLVCYKQFRLSGILEMVNDILNLSSINKHTWEQLKTKYNTKRVSYVQ